MNINKWIIVASLLVTGSLMAGDTGASQKPVKIFLLSGQSNMTGRGTLGDLTKPAADQQATLLRWIMEPANEEQFKYLYAGPKKTETGWTIRDDVFITMGEWPHLKRGNEGYNSANTHGGLGPYYGGRGNRGFGPEFAIGNVLGDRFDETILLVKVAFGGNSLGGNFRPPSSGGKLGDKYPLVVKALRDAITHLPEIVPGYTKDQGYEIAGFFWNQGLNDLSEPYATEYETNLANLIKDLRKEFGVPKLKTVVAVSGNWGRDLKELKAREVPKGKMEILLGAHRKVIDAQLAISKRPEFAGTVATAETRDFWRPRDEFGGHGTTEHWMANGESYWLIGEAMGREMVGLVERLPELDAYWAEVSRSVHQGDFAAYQAGCHEKGILVSGTKRTSYPLSQALARWKKEFEDTKAGKVGASVEFRFAHRYGDATTAHESGVFLYTSEPQGEEPTREYIEFEALLTKEEGVWKILMEYQKSVVGEAEWDALAPGA